MYSSIHTQGETLEPDLIKTRRRLPHWQLSGSTYFLTFRVQSDVLTMAERVAVLNHINAGHRKFYELFAAVVMPDHGHSLLKPNEGYDLQRIWKGLKGASARRVNELRKASGSVWQEESFDRIVRDAAEFDEKLIYIINNPVRAELVKDPWEYSALLIPQITDG
jgi:REP element-mobilizing transposase RayT